MSKIIKYLTQEELQNFLNSITDIRDKAIFYCMYRYGLRVGEVRLLNIEDINFEEDTIEITRLKTRKKKDKAGKQKTFEHKLYKKVKILLREFLKIRGAEEGALFLSRNKKGISTTRLDFLFKRYSEQAKIPLKKRHCHVLRHSLAVHSLDANIGLKEVQHLLNHANMQTTLIYANLSSRKLKKTYEILENSDEIVSI